jgi:hypothetical protein
MGRSHLREKRKERDKGGKVKEKRINRSDKGKIYVKRVKQMQKRTKMTAKTGG